MRYKITVPKAGTANELGSQSRLYELDEIVDAKEQWQKDLMALFVQNGWAMEIKVVEPPETVELESKVEASETVEAPKPKPKKKAAPKAKAKKKSD
tara:strand:+ start:180 stop:467 length:288 start_codon:yes stop_codon:yes gene_type:complete